MTSTHTVFADDAHRCATQDRAAASDLVLATAVTKAADLMKAGMFDAAEATLTRAGESAERILGTTTRAGAA